MLQTFFCTGLALTVYLIFLNIDVLSPYAWPFLVLFIALLVAVAVWAIATAFVSIKETLPAGKGKARSSSAAKRSGKTKAKSK